MPRKTEKCPTCGGQVKKQKYTKQIENMRMSYSKECLNLIDHVTNQIDSSRNIKLAEVYTEIGTEFVRPPRLPLFGAERTKVQHIIETALKSRPTLPNY